MRTTFFYAMSIVFLLCTNELRAAIYTVDNIADTDNAAAYTAGDGTNTLRKCMRLANAGAVSTDNINFNLPSPFTITLTTTSLIFTQPVIIDGYTQPGASAGNLIVQVKSTVTGIPIFRFNTGSSGSTVKGIVLYTNNGNNTGIYATSGTTNHVFSGNYIGTNAGGTAMGGTTAMQYGIDLDGSTDCVIGGTSGALTRNVISACSNFAIRVRNTSDRTTIQGNYIGTTASGNAVLANSNNGIDISSSNVQVIGGSVYGARNIICGNTVGLNVSTCATLTIKGNFIGLGADGLTAIANTGQGIRIQNITSAITIGGPLKQERNVIGSNGNDGINVTGTITGITIQNNYIGFDSTGLVSKPNANEGIDITNASTVLIGGSAYNLRNVIGNNVGVGVKLSTCTVSSVIKGNFIGLAANGTTAAGNTSQGINIATAVAVTVGGSLTPERNIISSNGNDGINMSGTITGVTIQNNYIGFDSLGTTARGNNADGIDLTNASTIVIGGSSYNLRNVIGNCTQVGLRMSNSTVSAVIKGNFIGLARNGATAPNGGNGVQSSTAVAMTIGGPLLAERNVVGSNTGDGFNLSATTGLTIQNNYIGFDTTGLVARNNTSDGIRITGATSTVLVGGSAYNLRNVIGNNGNDGLRISNATVSTIVKGNFIGLAVNGSTAAPNNNSGMEINNTTNVTIGGPLLPERNLVSSNAQRGITLNTSTPVVIQNNYVGLDSTGLVAKGNLQRGISVSVAASLTIGGTSFNLRNVVANNGQVGIAFDNSPNAIVKGNFIGLAKNGTTAMGNGNQGLLVSNSNTTTIGGSTLAERNVISSNLQRGVEINNSNNVTFVNNYVGVDSTGSLIRGNIQAGVAFSACTSAVVGGTSVNLRNIISNNGFDGLRIDNSPTPIVQGNYIGVDVTGLLDFGNGENGVNVFNAGVATIGGSTYSARNIISGNGQDGIILHDNCGGSIIKANFCGVGKDGVTVIGNHDSGIRIYGNTTSNGIFIGGSLYAERNIATGNGFPSTNLSRDGIRIEGNASNHIIKGNYCGTDSTGTIAIGNEWAGLSLNEVSNAIVGGTGTYEGNICAANTHEGMYLRNAVNLTITGNFVGTDKTGTLDMGNGEFGINVRQISLNNTIGGNTPALQNIVAYTKADAVDSSGTGVYVEYRSQYNRIVRNKIYCNAGLGIAVATLGNEGILAPMVTTATANSVSGTGSIDGDSIHVYHTNVSGGGCDCEGETFIGATIVSGGTWSITHGLNYSIPTAYDVTATETTANKSTSQFSVCNAALPVEFISFTVKKFSDRNIAIQWSTGWEQNSSYFLVERKNEKGEFESIARVSGRGNVQGLSNYAAEDQNPLIGMNYYRIRQVDVDGHSTTTAIRAIQVDGDGLQILLTAEGVGITSPVSTTATLGIYSELGQELVQKQIQLNANTYYPVSIGLQNGIYLFYVSTLEKSVWKKVPVRQ
ncbi:MAG: alkaline phosphatase [Chitinophagaceae bacterium]|nr:alkaline phosphatase [Chitinophagaceae bacterium]